jgi:hypothetical protein
VDTNQDAIGPATGPDGFDRRRLFTIGGTSLLLTAVAAACGKTFPATIPIVPTTTLPAAPGDVLALRTASSIELAGIQLYTKALAGTLIASTAVSNAFKLFQTHHTDHSMLLQAKTTDAGGQPYTQPNSLVMDSVITPRLNAATSERDLTQLAFDFERAIAATYQEDSGSFTNPSYNVTAMSMGGMEARHVSVLANLLGQTQITTDGSFQKPTGAYANGSGLTG